MRYRSVPCSTRGASAAIATAILLPALRITSNPRRLPGNPCCRSPALNGPDGVAVATAATVYVADSGNNRVLKLAAGSATPTVLPFTGLNGPDGVAVDTAGDLYVADHGEHRGVTLAA